MWRYSRKIERVCGRVFLIVFLLMLSASWIMPVLRGGKKDPFDLEGRLAEEIPAFDARSFLNGTFQDKLEKALSDQTIAGETLRVKYQGVKHKLFNQLSWISIRAGSGYRLVGNGLYTYDGHDYIVTNAAGNLMKSFEKNDAKIQESVRITKKEEFDNYLKSMTIKGLGGTDFRPVFTYVDTYIPSLL